jgi:hypothetical protein
MIRASGRVAVLAAMLGGAACADEPPGARDSVGYATATGQLALERDKWIVSPGAIGALRIGMTTAEMGRAIGDSVIGAMRSQEECTYVRPQRMPAGAALMLSRGRLVRIDVDSGEFVMDTGLRIGDSEVAVMVMHVGRVHVEPHKYRPPPAHSLTVTVPNDTANAIVFVTDGAKIASFRAGRRSAVELVERCG